MGKSLLWARIAFGLLFMLVTFLTLTPNPDDTKSGLALTRWIAALLLGDAAFADKVAHFLAYALLGATAFWARIALFGERWIASVALALYGAGLEGLQGLGGVRAPELADALANAMGAGAGLAFGAGVATLMRRAQ